MNAIAERITGIQHIGLPTNDMEKKLEFYKTLGFELAYETMLGVERVCFLRQKNICFETYQNLEDPQAKGYAGAIDHIALDVDDVEKAWEAVKAAGLTIKEDEIQFLPFWEKGVRFFNVAGPNGETVEFSQML